MKLGIVKRITAACLGLAMALGPVAAVHAEDSYKDGMGVTFTGSAMESNFDASSIYRQMFDLLPGDSVEMRVDLYNSSTEYTQWYISSETLKTLEETRETARDGGYGYYLAYTSLGSAEADKAEEATNGTVVLFESESIGGTGSGEKGLYEANEGIDGFVKLCTMAPGSKGYVTLYVKLDGETQGNGYQNTLAKLRLMFAVDVIPANYIYVPGDPTTETVQDPDTPVYIPGDPVYVIKEGDPPLSDIPKYTTVPQTGDTKVMIALSTLAMMAGIGGIVLFIAKRRKDEAERSGRRVR